NAVLHAFRDIFYDWNEKNPFLYGISWTSVMEVAIRAISQMYALAFLSAAQISDKQLIDQLETSIINCINYITRHYSRYSSANNHLLVEMTAIGLAGYTFDIPKWRKLAVETLTEQLHLQTYPDGVNREVSLHYHSFAMEAYLLLANVMLAAGEELPTQWQPMLDKMATFLASSMVDDKTAIEFGDSDEGKIIDLQGGRDFNHYEYVLQLASFITRKRYHSFSTISESIYWLYPDHIINKTKELPLVDVVQSKTFTEGGYSFLRSRDNRTIVAIDHAALGFGTIAAHGHDDALSFQLYRDGKPIFGDPGTGIYHCNLPLRNRLRDARHHSTVTINGRVNAEMRGAFLWGRKPMTSLYISELTPDVDTIIADTIGLSGIKHRRKFTFDKISSTLIIDDEFEQVCDWVETFVIAPGVDVDINGNRAELSQGLTLSSAEGKLSVHDGEYSQSYGCLTRCNILTTTGHGKSNTIIIEPK
ncbi:MAG: heparinase II/III family protein, partial [Muribaculaceae bacterium]|nr:heparinase II/III family protein [Muribaculaceae bacterium]